VKGGEWIGRDRSWVMEVEWQIMWKSYEAVQVYRF
jgi:hypothetical protein